MAEQNVFDHLGGAPAPSSASPSVGVVIPRAPKEPDTPSPLRATEVWRMLSNDEKKQRNLPIEQNFQINDAGKIETVSEGGLTESQAKAQGFYQRMRSSETQMKRLRMGPQDWTTLVQQRISPTYSRANLSDNQRTQLDLMENWIAASLRLESGAAIGIDEFQKQARIFFPQPGAGEKEQATKDQQRELAILGFGSTAGRQGRLLADENLRGLGFIDKEGKPIIAREPGAPPPSETPQANIKVAQGTQFATDEDFQRRKDSAEAWSETQGLPFDQALIQFNSRLSELGYGAAEKETIDALQWWEKNQPGDRGAVQWQLPVTGTKEEGGPGRLSAVASGLVSGTTAGLAEEAVNLFNPEAAARMEAARQYGQEQYPGTTLGSEIVGGLLSPLGKIGPAGTVAGEATRAGVYGGLFGAGNAPPDAGLVERIPGAVLGATIGTAGGAAAQKYVAPAIEKYVSPAISRFLGQAPEQVIPEVPPGAMAPGAPAAAPIMEAASTPEAAAELGKIIREASGTGSKAKAAQTQIAEMAQVNVEARAAAERLGIDVPADVFSDSAQIRSAIGLTRSLAGSEAEAAWRNTVSAAVDQADNVMRDFDAQFVEGAVSSATVSQRVKDSLTKTRADLNAEASAIYKQVDEAVPKGTPVQMDNLQSELAAIASEVGEGGMTAQEKRLLGIINASKVEGGEAVTYGRLIREKNLIGKALKREESPYGSMDEATLKRLYGSLATDQLDNVERIGGAELRSQLRGANLIYAKERALGERIVNAFGKDLEGGIAGKMRSAITGAAKGDPGEFVRLMKAVPADLRKEVVATALTSATRSARGAEKGGFGFSEFADLYPKLRANPQAFKQIVETLGPNASDTLRDLYQVSKRITEARANVLTTGKANQALVESLNAEGIVSRIMDSTLAKRVVGGAAGMATGGLSGAVMPDIMAAMAKGNPEAVRAAGKMFISPEFQSILTEAATQPEVTQRAVNRAASSSTFRNFAKTIGLDMKDAQTWLRAISQESGRVGGEVGGSAGEPLAPPRVPAP